MSRISPIISIGLLILLVLGGIFVYWPKYEKFKELNSELEIKDKAFAQKQEYFAKLNNLSKKLEDYKDQIAKIDSAFPQEISEPDLFNFIQKESSKNGLILKKIGSSRIVSSQSEGEAVQEISFSVSVSGSYSAFKNFLFTLYQNSRLIEVSSIKFSSKDKTDLLDFDLGLTTYYYPKPEVKEPMPGESSVGNPPPPTP